MFDIYRNKKVLVTGHTGFKGSWLTLWLLNLGAEVIGYALDPKTERGNYVLCELNEKIIDYRADIRDNTKLRDVIENENPEIIFHLAAQPLVLESFNNPLYTIDTNTLGTANVLEAFRNSDSAKVLILITTDKVYQNNEWDWGYRENDRLGGKDPYSASKAAAEIIIEAYRRSFFFKESDKYIASARAGNVIGGGDWSENRIVPDCIKAIEKNQKIIVRNPLAIRPWQHVLEPLGGYLLLGEKLMKNGYEFTGAWNFGPVYSNIINVVTLVNGIIKEYGSGEFQIKQSNDASLESSFLSLDIAKACSRLRWQPLLSLTETISYTVRWYKEYLKTDIYNFSIDQITRYENLWKLRNEN